jgi:hypothetical protein
MKTAIAMTATVLAGALALAGCGQKQDPAPTVAPAPAATTAAAPAASDSTPPAAQTPAPDAKADPKNASQNGGDKL